MLLNKRLDRIRISTNDIDLYEMLRLNVIKQLYSYSRVLKNIQFL